MGQLLWATSSLMFDIPAVDFVTWHARGILYQEIRISQWLPHTAVYNVSFKLHYMWFAPMNGCFRWNVV